MLHVARTCLILSLALAALAALPSAAAAVPPPRDRYIVVLKAGDPGAVAAEHGRRHAASDRLVYRSALRGYAARIPPGRVAAVRDDPRVRYVVADGLARAVATQSGAVWGLDRIDQRSLPLNGLYGYSSAGTGVKAYIIDTGIRPTHAEFGGRAVKGADFVDPSTGGEDCDGHGTHVAGTVGGSTYGVAKGVSLVGVRVLDCDGSGYWSWVIKGIDWVTADHPAGAPAVANMSLGGGANTAVDDAVTRSIGDGVTYALAAGNSGQDACRSSPARTPAALTMGATDSADRRPNWSNWGSCVDWFAPGVSIRSAYHTSNTATATMSGTSMASPHTAGAAALYLQDHPTASPAAVRTALWNELTTGIVTSSKTAANHLLYVGFIGSATPGNASPTAAFTYGCTALGCSFDGSGSGDSDGSVVGYQWTFGDGASASGASVAHEYATGGTYTVTLTVTDDKGATGQTSQNVTVSSAATGIALSATGYKVKGLQKADLSWNGAGSAQVDVWRSGVKVSTTANDGFHTDDIDSRGGGSYTYRVCEAGTGTCSPDVTVAF